jgi:HlyD family secretion protein
LANNSSFRRAALDRVQSADKLDALPAVGQPQRALLRVALTMLLLTALGWVVFGVVDTRVKGRCIIISPHGVSDITSSADGRLSELRVRVGSRVEPGDLVATIRRPAFEEQLPNQRERLAELRARQRTMQELLQRSFAQGEKIGAGEAQMLETRLQTLQARRELLQKRVLTQRQLQQEGLVTRQSLLATEQQFTDNALEADQIRSRIKQTAFSIEETRRQQQNDEATLALQVSEAGRELDTLLTREKELLQVRSPFAGLVIEVKADRGKLVSFGDSLVVIERTVAAGAAGGVLPLNSLIFVPGGDGKLVRVGMSAEVTPSTVKRQEYGFVRATVEAVSDYPASADAIAQLIQNPNVVRELAGDLAPVQISARLLNDPVQGYAWSAAAGVAPQVRSGTLCDAEIIVRSQRPYQLVWPLLKKIVGAA